MNELEKTDPELGGDVLGVKERADGPWARVEPRRCEEGSSGVKLTGGGIPKGGS